MKNNVKNLILLPASVLVLMAGVFSSCNKDKYFIDGGTSVAEFKGTALEYLKSKPVPFDTIATIVKLAGLENVLTNDTVTFFAPQDYSVARSIKLVNSLLFQNGKDTVKVLSDINGAIWRKYLLNYLYKGANKLKDYPQVDFKRKNILGGQNYFAYSGEIFNIGVQYADVGGVQYAGYRQLEITYIPNPAQPFDNWNTTAITSSDIQPYHSVVHVLSTLHTFGFDPFNFAQDVFLSK